MNPPIEHVVIHGHDVCFRREGEGPVVLLIHGIAGSCHTWDAAMPFLSRELTVVAPDLLGHGESAKPRGDYSLGAYASGLRDLLAVLGIERATLVGQSLGGGIAMQMAYQHPELCERLVLVDSGGLGREVSWILRAMSFPGTELLMPVLFPALARQWGDAALGFFRDRGVRSRRLEETWRAYASLTVPDNRHSFARTVRSVIDPGGQSVSAQDRLYLAARVPTMIVWGAQDHIIPVSHGRQAHEMMPGSRLEVIDGCGHFPHAEEPQRFAELLLDFMATTTPAVLSPGEIAEALRTGGAA